MTTKPRTCLKCSKTFRSTGVHHRICAACTNSNNRVRGNIPTSAVRHGGRAQPTKEAT